MLCSACLTAGSRSPLGGVDCNFRLLLTRPPSAVAPLSGAWIEISVNGVLGPASSVAPLSGAWIEMSISWGVSAKSSPVAPLSGAWIEIYVFCSFMASNSSLPSRGRGLKSQRGQVRSAPRRSLPSRGRGLKYKSSRRSKGGGKVAPLSGAWIEILNCNIAIADECHVAPLSGAWIEIRHGKPSWRPPSGRSPLGGVD